jgi:hypothetical protein
MSVLSKTAFSSLPRYDGVRPCGEEWNHCKWKSPYPGFQGIPGAIVSNFIAEVGVLETSTTLTMAEYAHYSTVLGGGCIYPVVVLEPNQITEAKRHLLMSANHTH